MARLPGEQWLIQQNDGMVALFNEYTDEVIVQFDPSDANAAAQAQHVIAHSDRLDAEQKCFAHFWSGYFYRNAVGS